MSKLQIITRCRRCKRPLSNPTSIDRGYGPICWGKIQFRQESKEEKYAESYALAEVKETILRKNGECVSCGKGFTYADEIHAYEHSGGISLDPKDPETKLWIYMVCGKCGYQNALHKIVGRIEHLERQKEKELLAYFH